MIELTEEQMLWIDTVKLELHKGNTCDGAIRYADAVVEAYKAKFKNGESNNV